MHILTADQIRAWDEYTITNEPVLSIDLMERAATACFNWLRDNGYLQRPFAVFCGPGNNGGDGLAIARLLCEAGSNAEAFLLSPDRSNSDDYRLNLERAGSHRVAIHPVKTLEDIPIKFEKDTVIIDALFGTGLNKPLTGKAAALVAILNCCNCEIISIDLPSGLHTDQPSHQNTRVKATHTLTFQSHKLGLLLPENVESFGEVHVLDIGLHPDFLNQTESRFQWIDETLIKTIFRPRNAFTHKGDYGHAALITGSIGMMGAATLCAAGCMRSGVGKLTCYVPEAGYGIIQAAVPEAMAAISGEDHITKYESSLHHEAIGIGPGIGLDFDAKLLKKILAESKRPLLLDADALTLLSKNPKLFQQIPEGSVLTPHPKEFDRMFGEHANNFERLETLLSKAKELQLVIVLKGHHTCIALPGGKSYFNSTGNAGMATGGSGDVLAGIITGLMAQGYTSSDAAILGVYLHGLAGDLAAKDLSKEAMIASDIIAYLPWAFQEVSPHT